MLSGIFMMVIGMMICGAGFISLQNGVMNHKNFFNLNCIRGIICTSCGGFIIGYFQPFF